MDHLPTNRSYILEELADYFRFSRSRGDFLHAPLLFADGNKKLSKSLGDAVYIDPYVLIEALRDNTNLGLDVRHAPVSKDIISLGPYNLPPYMTENKQDRLAALAAEAAVYASSGQAQQFQRANDSGRVTNCLVGRIMGFPHL